MKRNMETLSIAAWANLFSRLATNQLCTLPKGHSDPLPTQSAPLLSGPCPCLICCSTFSSPPNLPLCYPTSPDMPCAPHRDYPCHCCKLANPVPQLPPQARWQVGHPWSTQSICSIMFNPLDILITLTLLPEFKFRSQPWFQPKIWSLNQPL